MVCAAGRGRRGGPLLRGRGRARLRAGDRRGCVRMRCGARWRRLDRGAARRARPAAARAAGRAPDLEQPERTARGRAAACGCSTPSPRRVFAGAGAAAAGRRRPAARDRETCQLLHYLLRSRPEARLLVVATARARGASTATTRCRSCWPVCDAIGAAPSRSSWAARPGRDRPARRAAHRRAARRPDARGSTPRPRATRCSSSRRSARAGRRRPAQPARAIGDRGPARPAQRRRPRAGRGGGDDRARVQRRRARRGRRRRRGRPACAASTSCGGGGSCGSGAAARGGAYDFSHDKIREVAYVGVSPPGGGSCTCGSRPRWSGRTPPTRSGQRADRRALRPGGAAEQAVAWYRRARRAAASSCTRAVRPSACSKRALGLLRRYPPSREARRGRAGVQTALLAPLMSIDGIRVAAAVRDPAAGAAS